ncbi:hypothetical protein ENBRE01_1612 [Enteropsectra breve]|nr:hypothetical protein ENBRE01_1612 [Enteropsectra breve]
MKEILITVLHKPAENILKSIPLSNSTVQRRLDEMAKDFESSLCDYLKKIKFSIQLDESTLPKNESILLSFVWFLKDEKPCEELLFAKSLATDCKGITIFSILQRFFQGKILR